MTTRAAIALVAIMLVSVVGVGLVAAASPTDDLSFSGDKHAPNPMLEDSSLTVAKHPIVEGTSHTAMAGYYDDNGDWEDSPGFVVNTTASVSDGSNVNPYTFDAAKIEDPDRAEFPRTDDESGDNTASVLDASEWTEDESNTAGSGSSSDTTIASGVDAVQISTSSQTGGDTYDAGYGNWSSSFDSDEAKRVLQVAGEVNSMDSGAYVNVTVEDESGDKKAVMIEPDATQSKNVTVAYGQTSGTFAYQVKLSALPTNGGGSWDNIEQVNLTVHEGNADVSLSWLAFDKKGKTTLAEKQVDDGDSDSGYDNYNTTYNATSTISTHSIGTLDADFDDATLTDVQFPAQFPAEMIEGEMGQEGVYAVYWEDAGDWPSFDTVLNVSYRMEMPSVIDLSPSSPTLELEQTYPSGRYLEAQVAEDVSDSTNLSQASFTDKTGSLASAGDWVQLDGSASAGQDYVVNFHVKLTDSERDATEASAGGGGQFEGEGGDQGILGMIWSPFGFMFGSILTALGFRSAGKRLKGEGA